jgi:ABC-type multidrug transport system ATPase subunit/pSer/pThr/pTyr-binding forkhead associated (FHA) protein/ABC-type multidrug transport system permease subunit
MFPETDQAQLNATNGAVASPRAGGTAGYLQSLDPLLMQPQYPVAARGLRIGRDAVQCEVILSRDFVSRLHCSVAPGPGGVVIRDANSKNGVYVGGERINERLLGEGDVIALGDARARHFGFSRTSRPNRRASLLPVKPLYTIGRTLDNDLPFPADPTVSSRHARVRPDFGGQVLLEDLGSSNGTYVNGLPVKRAAIGPDDIVRIGSMELRICFTDGGLKVSTQDRKNHLSLQAVGLSRIHRGHAILRDVHLVVEPGEFVGVLGPSGAGKSTLLNALCGFQPANRGDVLLNGQSLYAAYDMFRNSIGYVPQDDIIHTDLSVERSLAYTAQLRLPGDTTATQIGQQVTGVIETLGLSHVRANPVARLSGGQRKRVSIGCELLTRPSLLFLDEPTSGLDPSTEEKLMKHFGQMAGQGQTVILTTHILYSLDLVHLVVILARGRLVYFGPVSEVCAFFRSPDRPVTRPLEIFEVLEPESDGGSDERERRAEELESKYWASALFKHFVVDRAPAPIRRDPALELPASRAPAPATDGTVLGGAEPVIQDAPKLRRRFRGYLRETFDLRQLGILVRRTFDRKLSFAGRMAVPLLAPIVLALFTATIKVRDQGPAVLSPNDFGVPLSLPLMMVMTGVFLGTLSACLEISGERSIYLRERAVNLKIPIYIGSKLPYLFTLALVQCFVYVVLTAALKGLDADLILNLALITTAVACASCAVGLAISSLDPTAGQNSVILAVVAVLPQMLLSGAMFPSFYGGMSGPAKIIAAVLPARRGFEMMLTTFYGDLRGAEQVIHGIMGFRYGSLCYATNAAALAAIALGFLAITSVSLRRYDRL